MCTVTFIPVKDKVFITSNRDEKKTRKSSALPAFYSYNETRNLLYPKDPVGNGTWICLKENGDAAVLLNGAFFPFTANTFQISRGQMLLDIVAAQRPSRQFIKSSLWEVAPFTLILFEAGSLYEFRWDGNEKFCKQLPAHRPHIWSSVTLYDSINIKKREHWFASFLNNNPLPTQKDIIDFHQYTGDGNEANNLVMKRGNLYSTVSITSIFLTRDRGSMKHLDILNNISGERKIELTKLIRQK
jgi:uncharacterized protein with NRDE domain